jgi:hypothetical protein
MMGRKAMRAERFGDALHGVTSPRSPVLEPLNKTTLKQEKNINI